MIRRLFSLLVFFTICFAVVGYFRGWYTLTSPHEGDTNKLDFHISLNKDKIRDDAGKVEDFARTATTQAKQGVEKAADAVQQSRRQ